MEDSGANRDTDTMGVEQAKLLMKLICGPSTDFRELKELRVRARFPDNNQRRILTQEAQCSQHMALASMAAAFQSLQVCIPHSQPLDSRVLYGPIGGCASVPLNSWQHDTSLMALA